MASDGSAAHTAGDADGAAAGTPSLGDASESGLVETDVAGWMRDQVAAEVKRLADQGAAVEVLAVKNCGIIREEVPEGSKSAPAPAREPAAPKPKRRRGKGKVTRRKKEATETETVTGPRAAAPDGAEAEAEAETGAGEAAYGGDSTDGTSPDAPTRVVNRVEVDTDYDFERVRQILTSPPVPCPLKPGFEMVNVVLLEERSPKPRILAYMYDSATPGQSLQRWLFVNRLMQECHHEVSFAEEG